MDRVFEPDQPGLLPFLRYFDLSVLKQTNRVDKIGYDPQKVDYKPDNPGIMFYVGEGLASWRVHQVRKQLPNASQDQANRFLFWAERLVEITKYSPKQLRAIANEGLDKIYGREAVE